MKKAKYPKGYILATILFVVISGIFLILSNIVYVNGRQIYRHGFTEVNAAYTIRASLGNISNQFQKVRMLAQQPFESEQERGQAIAEKNAEIAPKIREELTNLENAMTDLKSISDLSDTDKININELDNNIEYLIALSNNMLNAGTDKEQEVPSSELTPEERRAQTDAQRLTNEQNSTVMADAQKNVFASLDKALAEWRSVTDVEITDSRKSHIISNYMMIAIMVLVSIAIIAVGFIIKRKETEVFQQREVAQYQESRAEKAKAKTTEIAYKNLIMDCGNRYSLTEQIDSMLRNERSFFVGRFDLVDFSGILSQVGYDRIDQFMTDSANTIKSVFNGTGTLFTTAGEDFIFVFDEGISDTEIQSKAEHIRKVIGDTLAATLNIESAVTASVIYSEKYKNRSADAMLTALRSAGIKSAKSGQLILL